MSLQKGLHVLSSTTPQIDRVVRGIVYIHALCIVNDHTMATFLPPLSCDRMHDRWQTLHAQVAANQRIIIVHISDVADRTGSTEHLKSPFSTSTTDLPILPENLEVSGIISLFIPITETGSFRGEVQNFFVHPLHRKRGVGAAVMAELERQARSQGRWNLMLDTTVGTPAETVYERLGWTRLGVVRDYGYRPTGRGDEVELADEVWFWKDLRREA